MSGYWPARLYIPPKDKPRLATGAEDVGQIVGKAGKRSVTTALYRSLGERTVSITSRDGHFGGVAER